MTNSNFTSKKIISLVLSVLMLVSVFPIGLLETVADTNIEEKSYTELFHDYTSDIINGMPANEYYEANYSYEDGEKTKIFTVTAVDESGDPISGATVRLYYDVSSLIMKNLFSNLTFDDVSGLTKYWEKTTDAAGVAVFQEYSDTLISGDNVSFVCTVTKDNYVSYWTEKIVYSWNIDGGLEGNDDNQDPQNWAYSSADYRVVLVAAQKKYKIVLPYNAYITSPKYTSVRDEEAKTNTYTVPAGTEKLVIKENIPDGYMVKNLVVKYGNDERIIGNQNTLSRKLLAINADTVVTYEVVESKDVSIVANDGGSLDINGVENVSGIVECEKDAESEFVIKATKNGSKKYRIESLKFDGEEIEDAANQTEYTFKKTISKDTKLEVTFVEYFTVDVKVSEDGKVTLNGEESENGKVSVDVNKDEKIALKAEPNNGWRVSEVVIDGESTSFAENDKVYENTIDKAEKNMSFEITFAKNIYTVKVGDGDEIEYEYGEKVTVKLPLDNQDMTVTSVSIDGVEATDLQLYSDSDEMNVCFDIEAISKSYVITYTQEKKETAQYSDFSIIPSEKGIYVDGNNYYISQDGSLEFTTENYNGIRVYKETSNRWDRYFTGPNQSVILTLNELDGVFDNNIHNVKKVQLAKKTNKWGGLEWQNVEDFKSFNIIKDIDAPEFEINYSDPVSVWDTLLQSVTFGFYQKTATVTLASKGDGGGSGFSHFEYWYADENGNETEGTKMIIGEKDYYYDGESGKFVAKIEVKAPFRGKLEFAAVDNVGNSTYGTSHVIVVDETAPVITVTGIEEEVYSEKAQAVISIEEDNFFGADYEDEKLNVYVNDEEYSPVFAKNEENGKYEATVVFDTVGDYTLKVEYADRSGNIAESYSKQFCIETPSDFEIKVNGTDTKTVTLSIRKVKFKPDKFLVSTIKATNVNGDVDISSKAYEEQLKNIDNWTNDGYKHTIQLDFDISARYDISFTYDDTYTKVASAEADFCVDNEAPGNVEVTYSQNVWETFLEAITFGFYNAPATVTFTATDDVSGVAEFIVTEHRYDKDGRLESYEEITLTAEKIENTNKFQASITVDAPSQKRYSVKVSDNNKNVSDVLTDDTMVVVDVKEPSELDITISGESVLYVGNNTQNKYYSKPIEIELSAQDDFSGIQKIEYQLVSIGQAVVESNWIIYEGPFQVLPNETFVVYFKATDVCNNTSAIARSSIIVVDNQEPTGEDAPQIDIILSKPNEKGFYNDDVNVSVFVVDPVVNGARSGLQEVYLTVSAEDIGETETIILYKDRMYYNGADGTFDNGVNIDLSVNELTIDSEKFNSNKVVVSVYAIDNSGNANLTTIDPISIDVTVPSVKIEYDNNDAVNGNFFNTNRTATITVVERNFIPNDVYIEIGTDDGSEPIISSWKQIKEGTGNGDDAVWEMTILYNKDDDYTFAIEYADTAMNIATVDSEGSVATYAFTIDKTAPIVNVYYDNNEAENGNYYNAERIATVVITEHNFDAALAVITLTATDDGRTIQTPDVSAWVRNGDNYTAIIRYVSDARYFFDISVTDKSNNASADFNEQVFIVDMTAPAIEISGVEKNSANKGDVIPVVTFSDTNIDFSKVVITLEGTRNGVVELDGEYSDIHNGKVFTFNNFLSEAKVDDVYTLSVKAVDNAGNESKDMIVFTVNRFGSIYQLSDSAEKINGTYIKEPSDFIIYEYNADELSDIKITLFKNDETLILEEGEDFSVEVEGGNGSWYRYVYTIFEDNFTEDGVYRITVHSKDKAGNVAENTLDTKNLPVRFGVDTTSPNVVANLESGKTYAVDNLTVNLSVTDNFVFNIIEVYLDDFDKTYKRWNAEEIAQLISENGEFNFDILGDSNRSHDVRIVCIDAAGNEQVVDIENFYVTTNLLVRYFNNKPLFYGSIAGVLLLVAMIIFLVVYKKKKQEAK